MIICFDRNDLRADMQNVEIAEINRNMFNVGARTIYSASEILFYDKDKVKFLKHRNHELDFRC